MEIINVEKVAIYLQIKDVLHKISLVVIRQVVDSQIYHTLNLNKNINNFLHHTIKKIKNYNKLNINLHITNLKTKN
jgi:cell shape-determining protein MreC